MSKVVLKLDDNVSTDDIYPGSYMATVLPAETPRFCFADRADFNQMLNRQDIPRGSVIVAGSNFGCGSSREQAVSALQGHGLVVIAKGYARIFLHNAINLGLRTVICPTIHASEGDELELTNGQVRNLSSGEFFEIQALPGARQEIVEAGGLIEYTRKRLLAKIAQAKVKRAQEDRSHQDTKTVWYT